MRAARQAEHARFAEMLTRAEVPLVADLRRVGLDVTSVWDLVRGARAMLTRSLYCWRTLTKITRLASSRASADLWQFRNRGRDGRSWSGCIARHPPIRLFPGCRMA